MRKATGRHRGVTLKRMIADINPVLRGWAGYFGFSEGTNWRAWTAGSDDECAACCGRNGKRDDDGSRNSDARGSARN